MRFEDGGVGMQIRVVAPRASLDANVGDVAEIVALRDMDSFDVRWLRGVRGHTRGVYPYQFEPAGGPW